MSGPAAAFNSGVSRALEKAVFTPTESYRSYRDLPPLAGLATIADAAKPGLSVEACVARLKRYHYAFVRLHEILTARITAEPIYELKTGFSHHAYLCAEHVEALRTPRRRDARAAAGTGRGATIRRWRVFFDEILAAPTTAELLVGLYEKAHCPPSTRRSTQHIADTNPLADAPSRPHLPLRPAGTGRHDRLRQRSIACLVDDATRRAMQPVAERCSTTAWPRPAAWTAPTNRRAASPRRGSTPARPYVYDPVPRRDERFQDLWNQGVNAEAFLYDPNRCPRKPKALMMLFKRLREIDVPEMMASIIVETKGKPWGYYRDMSRQLWDEARHAMMGEVGFVALGVDWTQARITHNWSLRLNTECTPIERHAVLYFIEQGLMTKTGKRYEWEVAPESGIPLMATIQDYDWADEVLHAALGREWYIPQFGNWKEALDYGDKCWSRILSNWHTVTRPGPDAARELVAGDLPAGV